MRDFEDFRDAVLNKISALEVSDDEKWEKLCKVLIFCLVKSSYGPHVQNLELHLKHRSNGHLIYSPFDFANMGEDEKLKLHVFDRDALERDSSELHPSEALKLTQPLRRYFEQIQNGNSLAPSESNNQLDQLLFRLTKKTFSGKKNGLAGIKAVIWTLGKLEPAKPNTFFQIGSLKYEVEWKSLEEIFYQSETWPSYQEIEEVAGTKKSGHFSKGKKKEVKTVPDGEKIPQIPFGPSPESPLPPTGEDNNPEEEQSFIEELKEAILINNFEPPQNVIMSEIAELFEKIGRYDEINVINGFRNVAANVGIDAYSWNEETGVVSLFLLDAPLGDLEEKFLAKEFEKFKGQLKNFFLKSLSGYLIQKKCIVPGSEVGDLAIRLKEAAKKRSIIKVRLIVCSLRSSSIRKKFPIEIDSSSGLEIEPSLVDIDMMEGFAKNGEKLVVDFNQHEYGGRPLRMLKTAETKAGYKSFVGSIPGRTLAKIYEEFGQRVLAGNVRAFLQMNNAVNKGILKTIATEPEKFFAFNNGICLVAASLEGNDNDGVTNVSKLTELQIVNGGQTTASLQYAARERGRDLSLVNVPVKLSIVPPDLSSDGFDRQKFVQDISAYANSQSKVTTSDLGSNTAFQIKFKKLSIALPNQIPIGMGTKFWYYEQTRGSYREERRAFKRKGQKFEDIYPSSNKFLKTDVAKWCKTWKREPNIVSLGAQKCFNFFWKDLKEIEKNNPTWNGLDDEVYHNIIAKGILFKRMDSLILASDWYRQNRSYKINLVTYGLALLRESLVRQFGEEKDLNFKKIWDDQKLPLWLEELLVPLAYQAFEVFNSEKREISDIGEWVKKPACWEMLRQKTDYLSRPPAEEAKWIVPKQKELYDLGNLISETE